MKSLRLLSIAVLACACTASTALACDAHKAANTKTANATAAKKSASGACTAEMAAQCTPAMRAACENNAAVAAAMGCESKGVTTMTVVASANGKAAKGGDCCAMKGAATAATKSAGPAPATGTSAVIASNTAKGTGADHCANAKGTASAAGMGAKCAVHATAATHDCVACDDWMACEQDVRAMGAKAQVVPLKNGAMVVYTADSPGDVKVLQSMVAKRHDHMLAALSAGSSQKLCDECKQLRGAIASGKLHREVVNVERGCMTLMTSTDRVIVQKIRAMTGQPVAMR